MLKLLVIFQCLLNCICYSYHIGIRLSPKVGWKTQTILAARRSGGANSGNAQRHFSSNKNSRSTSTVFEKHVDISADVRTPLEEMPFSEATRLVLRQKGFSSMTPIQSQSYDLIYSGVDIVARSRTGTGKTFAFGLPRT